MRNKGRVKAIFCVLLSVVFCAFGVLCVKHRASQCLNFKESVSFLSAFSVMPDASLNEQTKSQKPSKKKIKATTSETTPKQEIEDNSNHEGEKTYKIQEINISSGEFSYNDFSVTNNTSYDMNVEKLLNSELGFDFKDTRQAQVLIVHTHTCESYMDSDEDFYYESFYPRTVNNEKNVTAVGEEIAKSLKSNGIGVVHAKTQHDYPSYDGAYDRSYDTIMSYLEKYKEIKVVLDIHRDSMTSDDMTKLKPTFTYNGEKAAQIMIMSGYGVNDSSFPFWEDNLKFALKLQNTCENMYSGMTRPLNFGEYTYNMNANCGSLLIEVGTDANSLEQAKRTGKMLGNALAQVLQNS